MILFLKNRRGKRREATGKSTGQKSPAEGWPEKDREGRKAPPTLLPVCSEVSPMASSWCDSDFLGQAIKMCKIGYSGVYRTETEWYGPRNHRVLWVVMGGQVSELSTGLGELMTSMSCDWILIK